MVENPGIGKDRKDSFIFFRRCSSYIGQLLAKRSHVREVVLSYTDFCKASKAA